MKYVIKVENLQNLPETRPLIAMDANGNIQVERKIPGPVPPVGPPNDEIWYTTTDGEPIELSGAQGAGSGADWPEYEILPYEGGKGVIKFSEDLTEIPSNGFLNIENLETMAIPNSVTSIGNYAFNNCTGLTSVTIPDSVTSIGSNAFIGCTGLPVVDNIRYNNTTGNLYLIGAVDKNQSTYNIQSGTKWIGDNAFVKCTALSSVSIPDSVTSIGYAAFNTCTDLTAISFGRGITSIGDQAFTSSDNITKVNISDLSAWCSVDCRGNVSTPFTGENTKLYINDVEVNDLVIPSDVTRIMPNVFSNVKNLTSITIPGNVTEIEWGAFSGCDNVSSITISDGVTSIGSDAFGGCTNVSTITIPDSVTSIYPDALKIGNTERNIILESTTPVSLMYEDFVMQAFGSFGGSGSGSGSGAGEAVINIYVPEEAYDTYLAAADTDAGWAYYKDCLVAPNV